MQIIIVEKRQEIEHLFNLYLTDQCTQEEVQLLMEYFNTDENEALLKSLIKKELETSQNKIDSELVTKASLDEIYQMIKKRSDESGEGA